MTKSATVLATLFLTLWCGGSRADGPGPADPLTTIMCRDREDPGVGATLVTWALHARGLFGFRHALLAVELDHRVRT